MISAPLSGSNAVNSFKDHFSDHATDYARYRPTYPESLFSYLASVCEKRILAWDCATGSGQAAHGLASHFERIIATDASTEQLAHAVPHEHITYQVAPAEESPLNAQSVDLITVAQALHWFHFDRFFAEVKRVLKPDGVVAIWTYGLLQVSPAIDAVVLHYYTDIVGPYWPPERRHVDEAYQTIPFPFQDLAVPSFQLAHQWDQNDLLGYLGTWSATRRYRVATGTDPVDLVREDLARAWDNSDERKAVRWPLVLRVGRMG